MLKEKSELQEVMLNQAYKAHKFVSLEADIEALKQKVDIKIAEKDM